VPHSLSETLDELAHLLPAQGPISIFIHHNTLHAFEQLPFEEAVEAAATQLDRQPFLPESRYRDKLASGRILAKDVRTLVREQLGAAGDHVVAGALARIDLWCAVLLHGIPEAAGRELSWILEETPALSRFRADLPAPARSALTPIGEVDDRAREERRAVRRLWNACLDAVRRYGVPTSQTVLTRPVRHRDWLTAACGIDTDGWIHPPLIRFLAGYLDQGLAHWPVPHARLGIHGAFLEIYSERLAAYCGDWARTLPRMVADDRAAGRDAFHSIAHSLTELGVTDAEWTDYLRAELLALRGWAGIVRQIEERPDRVPARDVIVTLRGYMAVRLLFERAALEDACRRIRFNGHVSRLRQALGEQIPTRSLATEPERAWPLFHVAQLCGLDAASVEQWTGHDIASIEAELGALDGHRRRRLLHQAFERTVRHRFYDALIRHVPRTAPSTPAFQAVFCLDEREESFRRHLEETDPSCETYGTAGFFNIPMYHQGVTDAHPRPLCPVAIRPDHYVTEIDTGERAFARQSRRIHHAVGFLGYNVHVGSRLPFRGALLATFGWLSLVPLILRVVFPWLSSRLRHVREMTMAAPRTRLQLERQNVTPPIGTHSGFTVDEMAAIVRRVLEDIGIRDCLSPLVLVIGHGSISLNNPHESAHDCGACGGGRGGPNARAFAQMANDRRVRGALASDGLVIDAGTWFVGAQRNTSNNDVTWFDEDLVPAEHRSVLARAKDAIDATRRREAHERCRRFDAVPRWYPPLAALAHVEARAFDLAQPRPEYGHATNAFCVVGRRARTRGLFLDRRAFLVSYDPTHDTDGAILARTLTAAVPVVAGINLEYYFSYVDPVGYGCGTKLPHNVTSLLGVMDGAQSDLRTGLPWQMVEIHEPTRLAIVVEGAPDRVLHVVETNAAIERLVRNRWIWLACLDPESDRLWELRASGFEPHAAEHALPVVAGVSSAWYEGKHGFIPPAAIVGEGVTA
jgi:uncharacterized protein YbcC (UPF0753/DUF2309 family)